MSPSLSYLFSRAGLFPSLGEGNVSMLYEGHVCSSFLPSLLWLLPQWTKHAFHCHHAPLLQFPCRGVQGCQLARKRPTETAATPTTATNGNVALTTGHFHSRDFKSSLEDQLGCKLLLGFREGTHTASHIPKRHTWKSAKATPLVLAEGKQPIHDQKPQGTGRALSGATSKPLWVLQLWEFGAQAVELHTFALCKFLWVLWASD